MTEYFQIYNNSVPELNETVLIKFIKKLDTHFEGILLEYNYSAIMSYNDATKKKKVYCWNKIVPLNKIMLAKIEDIKEYNNNVQVSIAFNDNKTDLTEQLKPFNDNKVLISLIKKVCYKMKLNFDNFWVDIIHPIDKQRKEEEENNLFEYFKINNVLLTDLLIQKYENYNDILTCINDNIHTTTHKITSKIGMISINGIHNTKKILEEILNIQTWNFTLKYDSAPFYILESYTSDSTLEDHQNIIELLKESAIKNKIFFKIEYVGKI